MLVRRPGLLGIADRSAILVFVGLMLIKFALLWTMPVAEELVGDSHDYVGKAEYFIQHGAFRPVRPAEQPVDASGQYSDYRPPGYPLVIAAQMTLFGQSAREVNASSRWVNFGADILTCAILLLVVWRIAPRTDVRWIGAALIGGQPWTSAFVTSVYPDTLVTLLSVMGVACLALFVVARSKALQFAGMFAGSLAFSIGALIRPEFSVVPPVLVVAAAILRHQGGQRIASPALIAAVAMLPFVAAMGANVGYRWAVDGRLAIYGNFEHPTPGLLKWTQTWIGTLEAKEAITWGPFQISSDQFDQLPPHAFRTEGERRSLTEISVRARARGYMTRDEDLTYLRVADERIRESPLTFWVWVRLFNAVHLWMNTGSASHYLYHQAKLPGSLSKVITGSMLLAKAGVLLLSVLGLLVVLRRGIRKPSTECAAQHWAFMFTALGLGFVGLRTVIFGFIRSFVEYRYSTPGWPFLLAAAMLGLYCATALVRERRARIPRSATPARGPSNDLRDVGESHS